MTFVFVLLGGMIGAVFAGIPGALLGAIVAAFAWIAWRTKSADLSAAKRAAAGPRQPDRPAVAVPTLVQRVQALESEIAHLRSQVERLSGGAAITAVDGAFEFSAARDVTESPAAAQIRSVIVEDSGPTHGVIAAAPQAEGLAAATADPPA
jgi:hypothetical protein